MLFKSKITPVCFPVLKEYFIIFLWSSDIWAYSEEPFRGLIPWMYFGAKEPLVQSFSSMGSPAKEWSVVNAVAHISRKRFIFYFILSIAKLRIYLYKLLYLASKQLILFIKKINNSLDMNFDKIEDDSRKMELIRVLEHSIERLSLAELEALYYDLVAKDYIRK